MENIKTTRPTKKLDIRHSGPFRIRAKISSHAYQLDLPSEWRIFDIFHVSLLRPFTPPLFDSQIPTPSPPIELSEDVTIPIYQVANILNSCNNSSTGKLEYLVEWAGREGTTEQVSWQLPSELADNGADIAIAEFHERYPAKPSIDTSPPRPRRPPDRHRKKHPQASSSSNPPPLVPISSPTSSTSTPSHPTAPHTPPSEQPSNQLSSSSPNNSQNLIPPTTKTPTSSRPPNVSFRPKQPANWKGWALVPELPSVADSVYDGPTSRSGRPIKPKTRLE